MPTDYRKDLPDFNKIIHLFKELHKRRPTLTEVKDIQILWNKIEPDEPEITRKPLF